MELFIYIFSPLTIVFAVLIAGYFLGRIKIWGISFSLAGVLVIAVAAGYLLSSNELACNMLNISEFRSSMQILSSLGTALFISVIGITTGYSLDLRKPKEIKAVLVGSIMVISAFTMMKILTILDKEVSYSKLLGALCGAMTTTPGLSAVNELNHVVADEATFGYSCTYLFGVMATVLFVQLTTRKTKMAYEEKVQDVITNQAALGGLIQIGIGVLAGRLIGSIGFSGFSLGNSGGMLCVSIILGVIVQLSLPHKTASLKTLGAYRDLGLILFFVGNGIPAGISLINGFDIKIIVYGALMTVIPIMVGVILCKAVDREHPVEPIIAGGMTSTPAIGVLMQKQGCVHLGGYSMAYVGALLTIIILVRNL